MATPSNDRWNSRSHGLAKVRRLTAWAAFGSVVAAGGLAGVAAASNAGHAPSHAAGTSTNISPPTVPAGSDESGDDDSATTLPNDPQQQQQFVQPNSPPSSSSGGGSVTSAGS